MKNLKFSTLLMILCFTSMSIFSHLNAQNNFCPGNIFQNGDLEIGTPTASDQDINLAAGYSEIWTGASWADFYISTQSPFTTPSPASGNWGGFWVSNSNTDSPTYREGLFNTLNTTILPNTGVYSFTYDLACLGGWGTAELAIYGIYNPSGNVSPLSPITNHLPPNEDFFGAANTVEFGTTPINTCSNTKVTHTITFDSADPLFPAAGITHVLLTHSSSFISGARYVGVDNFCMVYDSPSPSTDCVTVINENTICNSDGSTTYSFDFTYNGTATADNFIVTDLLGNTLFNVGGLNINNGDTYSTVSFTIPAGLATYCYRIRLFGEEECCHIEHCIDVPYCDPCESVRVESHPLQSDEGDCCHSIDVDNNFNPTYFTNITSTIITPGVVFSNPVANSGWSVSGSGNSLNWTPPTGYVSLGVSSGVMDFCLDNIILNSQIPQTVVFDWWAINPDGTKSVVCSDTLQFDCSDCLFISDDFIECLDDGTYGYNFSVWNNTNPAHDATDIRIVPLMAGVCLDGNGSFTPLTLPLPGSPLPSGGSANISLNISDCGAGLIPGSVVPFRLVLLDNGVDLDWCCHVDTLWVTIPDCPNNNDCTCDDFPNAVAQGFSVTGGGIQNCNRTFTPLALSDCDVVQWHIDGDIVSTTNGNASYTYNFSNGSHFVCMIVTRYLADGTICGTLEFCRQFDVSCIGDPIGLNPNKEYVTIIPNPSSIKFNFIINNIGNRAVSNVEILNTSGRKMRLDSNPILSESNGTVDVRSFPAGTYIIRITFDNGESLTEKFLKVN